MGSPCRDSCRGTGGLFSVPLGCADGVRSVPGWSWPPLNPRDRAPQPLAEIDRRPMQGQLAGCSPQFQLVPVTVTAMAVVAAERQVHGEGTTPLGRRLMQGTAAVPLRSRATHRLEGKQVEYLRHRDLSTQAIEVDTGHGTSSSGGRGAFRSLPLERGTGTAPRGSLAASPTRGGHGRHLHTLVFFLSTGRGSCA